MYRISHSMQGMAISAVAISAVAKPALSRGGEGARREII